MTVLVTGGAGYIGSHTVRALRAAGTDVVVLDTLEFGHAEAVLDAPLEVGDIADAELVAGIVDRYGVDAVVHFAGYKAVGESMEVPERYFDNNVARTARLLETLHVVWCPAGRVLVVVQRVRHAVDPPVDESHPTGPESPYAESKLLVERMLHWYDVCHGVRSVSLRYFNAAGASPDARIGEDSPKPLNLVPLAMLAALGKDPEARGVRHRLPDARRHVHPRLHPRRRPRRRARARARPPRSWRRHVRAEPGYRAGLVGAGGGRRRQARQRRRLPGRVRWRAVRATPSRCGPTTRACARRSAGSRSTTSTTSSRARGHGTPHTRTATPPRAELPTSRNCVAAIVHTTIAATQFRGQVAAGGAR